jgi:hypothetical protein
MGCIESHSKADESQRWSARVGITGCSVATTFKFRMASAAGAIGRRLQARTQSEVHSCMDEDLESLSRDELVAEVKRLRAGIREHRDSTKHELCWHHPQLWGLLPEKIDPAIAVPAWPQFLRGCVRYRKSLDRQMAEAPRVQEEFQSPPRNTRP